MNIKKFFLYVIMPLYVLLYTSCEDENDNYTVGSDWVGVNTKVYSIDTMTVKTYTIQLDSVPTSGKNLLLVGKHQDPNFGLVKSEAYTQFTPEALTLDNDAKFDSIRLLLVYTNDRYGDTLQSNKITVFPVTKRIRLDSDTGYLYNTSTVSSETTSVGEKTYLPRPNTSEKYVRIPLSSTFGNYLFNVIQHYDLPDNETFYQYFKGFVLKNSETDNSVITFDGDASETFDLPSGETIKSVLRMYYHYDSTDGSEPDAEYFDFNMNGTYQFNHISSDFSGTPLASLTPNNPIPSTATENKSYMIAGLGVFTRIEVPYIISLYNIGTNIFLSSASMYLRPVNNTYTYPYKLPTKLYYYIGDSGDNLVSTVTDSSGSEVEVTSNINNQFQEDNYYTFPMSNFMNTVLTSSYTLNNTILIYPSSYTSLSLDRMVIGNQKFLQNQLELNVNLIKY